MVNSGRRKPSSRETARWTPAAPFTNPRRASLPEERTRVRIWPAAGSGRIWAVAKTVRNKREFRKIPGPRAGLATAAQAYRGTGAV